MNVDELRAKAKAAGIKSWHVKSEEKLLIELEELEDKPDTKDDDEKLDIEITMSEKEVVFLKTVGLDSEWLASLANQYNFSKFEYVHKFRAFRCYQDIKHVEWIGINDLAMLNGKEHLCQILQKHQEVDASRSIIHLPWNPKKKLKINDKSLIVEN